MISDTGSPTPDELKVPIIKSREGHVSGKELCQKGMWMWLLVDGKTEIK